LVIALTDILAVQVSGIIPAGYYARLRTTGTSTISYLYGDEDSKK